MENVIVKERRNFLKGIGLVGAVVAGYNTPVLAKETKTKPPVIVETPKVDPKIIQKIEEMDPSSLSLQQVYGEIEPPKPPPNYTSNGGLYTITDSGFVGLYSTQAAMTLNSNGNVSIGHNHKKFIPGTEKTVDVKLVPGPDGELYLNINGQWKKVLTV